MKRRSLILSGTSTSSRATRRDGRARDRVRRCARHRQVARQHDPDQQRLHGRRPRQAGPDRHDPRRGREHQATRSGSPRCSSRPPSRCRCASQELHSRGLEYPLLVGGAAINRSSAAAIYPDGKDPTRSTSRASSTARMRSRGWGRWTSSSRRGAQRLGAGAEEARELREKGETEPGTTSPTTPSARPPRPTCRARAAALGRTRGAGRLRPGRSDLETDVPFKLHRAGRGVKGEAWKRADRRRLPPAPGAHVARAGLPAPARAARLFPRYSEGNEIVLLDPEDRETVRERLVAPRQPNGDRICLADFFRPRDSPASSTSSRCRP